MKNQILEVPVLASIAKTVKKSDTTQRSARCYVNINILKIINYSRSWPIESSVSNSDMPIRCKTGMRQLATQNTGGWLCWAIGRPVDPGGPDDRTRVI